MLETKPPKSAAGLTHMTVLSPQIWVVQLLYQTSTQQVTCLGHGRTPASFILDTNYSALLNIHVPSCMSLSFSSNMPAYFCFKVSKHCALSLTTYMHMSSLTSFDFTSKAQWASAPQNPLCQASCCIPSSCGVRSSAPAAHARASCGRCTALSLVAGCLPLSWRQHWCLSKLLQRAGLAENFSSFKGWVSCWWCPWLG